MTQLRKQFIQYLELRGLSTKLAEPEPIHCIVLLTTSEKITQTC